MSITFSDPYDFHTRYGGGKFVFIKNAEFSLQGCEILEDEVGLRAVVKLPEEMVNRMKDIEEKLNDHRIKLVYGNKMYAKKNPTTPKEHLKRICLKGVYVDNDGKPSVNMWIKE